MNECRSIHNYIRTARSIKIISLSKSAERVYCERVTLQAFSLRANDNEPSVQL